MTSRLAGAASPYLRSHADHPVAWYPWGEEAFAVARDRDVPVFISIGYSTCHWCHVMARESFASLDIAAVVNDGFVAIKVDREEHPEVDAAYMAAASAFTRNLGWPLSIFATPSGQTFHAGTYWPARAAGGVPAFGDVLAAVSEAWHARRGEVESSAAAVAAALAAVPIADAAAFSAADLSAAARRLMAREDPVHGGFGTTGAKFPLAGALGFLAAMPDDTANDVASFALRAMSSSELFDPVDGGFFRYATRPDWTQPHFERMLTDNAQLLQVAIALRDTALALRIGAFLRDVLLQPSGGFGAAQDAESVIDGAISEGGYYAAANRADLTPPAVDAKVVTGWNGLAIAALARLSLHTADSAWASLAADAAASVLERARTPRGWVRATLGDIASRAPASAADLAQLAAGLTTLAQATGEAVWAVQARELVDTLRADPQFGADPVLSALGVATGPDAGDGDEPSAAAALALAATDLADLGTGDEYRRVAEDLVQARFGRAAAEPLAYGATLQAATRLVRPPRQVIGVTRYASSRIASAARGARGDIVMILTPQQAVAFTDAGFDLLSGKTAEALYVCENFTCALPQTEAELTTPSPE